MTVRAKETYSMGHWLDRALRYPELKEPACLALQALADAGTDIEQGILDALECRETVQADTAIRFLRDQVNEKFQAIPMDFSLDVTDKGRPGSPVGIQAIMPKETSDPTSIFWSLLFTSLISQPPKYIRQCQQCAKAFEPKRPEAKYCSQYCRNLANEK